MRQASGPACETPTRPVPSPPGHPEGSESVHCVKKKDGRPQRSNRPVDVIPAAATSVGHLGPRTTLRLPCRVGTSPMYRGSNRPVGVKEPGASPWACTGPRLRRTLRPERLRLAGTESHGPDAARSGAGRRKSFLWGRPGSRHGSKEPHSHSSSMYLWGLTAPSTVPTLDQRLGEAKRLLYIWCCARHLPHPGHLDLTEREVRKSPLYRRGS